jgi:Glycosyl transferase family 11
MVRVGKELIIVQLAGGLGNQMFQYAAGRRLAHIRGVPLKLDLSRYGPEGDDQAPGLEAFRRHVRINEFNIVADQATPHEIACLRDRYHTSTTWSRIVRRLRRVWPSMGWPTTHFHERRYRFDPDVLELSAPCYLSGYWQSEKYFADIAETIRRDLRPRNPAILDYARDYVAQLRVSVTAVVSLHVRRGELAFAQDTLRSTRGVFGPPTGLDYIRQAIAQFEPGYKFLVFSDSAQDIEWCKENIKTERIHFSEGHTDVEDMMLMSACDHHIIASTFSWWAAWLGSRPGRRVIAPSQWGHVGGVMVTDDLIPSTWTMI